MRTTLVALLVLVGASNAVFAESAGTDAIDLARRGWAAIDSKRFGEAVELFTAAAAARPEEPGVAMGAGAAAFMLGRNVEAAVWLEKALQLNPRYVEASMLLGELHYRAGRVLEAIAAYEVAATHAPSRLALDDRLRAWKQEARLLSGFDESRTAHFSVLFEKSAAPVAGHVLDVLEAEYARVGAILGYPSEPITVVLYTREQFQDVTRLPAWAVGNYDGRIRIPVPGQERTRDELETVLGHELTHAIVSGLGGRGVPVWLNEGLASVLEPNGRDIAAAVLRRTGERIELSSLEGTFSTLPDELVELAYAQSADAAARLLAMGGPDAVVGLLRDLSAGIELTRAFEPRFGIRFEDFAQALIR